MTRPTDRHQLDLCLNKEPAEFGLAVAVRAALRVVPNLVETLCTQPVHRRERFLLPALCALAAANFAATWPQRASISRKAARRLARELEDTYAEEENNIQFSLFEWRDIGESPPSGLARDSRTFHLAARAADAISRAAQAAADFADVGKGIASETAPIEAATAAVHISCRCRAALRGATRLEPGSAANEDENASEYEDESLDAVLADLQMLRTASAAPHRAAGQLSTTPLWPAGPPPWSSRKWADLVDQLPGDENWWVWTDWYEALLVGAHSDESIDSYRASSGEDLTRGAVATNAAIAKEIKARSDLFTMTLQHAFKGTTNPPSTIDFDKHWRRIQGALSHNDPDVVVGETKDVLEVVMKTILNRRGHGELDNLKFPMLTDKCLVALGLRRHSEPKTPAERHAGKFASAATTMMEAINRLRNDAGTGHGRLGQSSDNAASPRLSVPDARLAASTGLLLAAWLLQHDHERPLDDS